MCKFNPGKHDWTIYSHVPRKAAAKCYKNCFSLLIRKISDQTISKSSLIGLSTRPNKMDQSQNKEKGKMDIKNACTLVPTVFRWHWKMGFKCHLHFLFSHDIEKQILFFVFASLWTTDMNFSFRFSFSHHFEKRIWILFFVFALLVIEKQIGVSFVMNLKSGLIHQSFETPPPPPQGDDRDNEGPFTS